MTVLCSLIKTDLNYQKIKCTQIGLAYVSNGEPFLLNESQMGFQSGKKKKWVID